jgi:hypothetical protein
VEVKKSQRDEKGIFLENAVVVENERVAKGISSTTTVEMRNE